MQFQHFQKKKRLLSIFLLIILVKSESNFVENLIILGGILPVPVALSWFTSLIIFSSAVACGKAKVLAFTFV